MNDINARAAAAPVPTYSHAIEVPANHRLLVVSGQLGTDENGQIPADCEAQTRLCLASIDRLLNEAGMSRKNVVRLNAYVTKREDMVGYAAARNEWVSELEVVPGSTLLVVSGFVKPEFLVEVEALAAQKV